MLPAEARIRRSRDFSTVLRRGRRAARGGVVVHWAPGPDADAEQTTPSDAEPSSARAGFVVSKAVGNAVVRNRVKRRLRHAVADQMRSWPPGTDVVVRATPKAAERDFSQLNADLADAVSSARRGKAKRSRGSGAKAPDTGSHRGGS
ncbi:ribonuclease P protein component [Glycomyces halotolerans]